MLRRLLICTIAGTASTTAYSQEKPREIDFYEQSSGGTTAVCGTDFTFVFKDTLGGKQSLMGVRGSLSHMGLPGKLVAFLKFTPMDFKPDLALPPTPFSPAQVTIQNANGEQLPFKAYACEPGHSQFCAALGGDSIVNLELAMAQGGVSIRFNRKVGLLDYELLLRDDTPVQGTPGEKVSAFFERVKKHASCMTNLARRSFGQ